MSLQSIGIEYWNPFYSIFFTGLQQQLVNWQKDRNESSSDVYLKRLEFYGIKVLEFVIGMVSKGIDH